MIIKKFTAPTMTEALSKVREELGSDAVILNTRTEKQGGVFDFLGRRFVEVTAAVDENPSAGSGASGNRGAASVRPDEARSQLPVRPVAYRPPQGRIVSSGQVDRVEVAGIERRLEFERLTHDINDLKRSMKVLADASLTGDMAGLPGTLATVLRSLNASGLEDRIAKRVVHQLLNDLTGIELTNPAVVRERAAALLAGGLPEPQPVKVREGGHRMVALVGPTGSGKTTTIAKLAADFSLNGNRRITVLTLDTRRVDAVGQLKAYCRILNVPLYIAYAPDDLPGIMPGIARSDMTLVDTPGAGPMDNEHMRDMVEFLHRIVPQEVHLVMSVTTALPEMERIAGNFSMLKPNRILFTKLDETDRYGPMLSFALTAGKPISYLTDGQSVPGDFTAADTGRLVGLVMDHEASLSAGTEA